MALKYQIFLSSIRAKLIFWFVLLAVVPLVASATFGYLRTRVTLEKLTLNYLEHVAPDAEIHLTEWIESNEVKDVRAAWDSFPEKRLLRKGERIYLVKDDYTMVPLSVPEQLKNEMARRSGRAPGVVACMEQNKTVTGVYKNFAGEPVYAVYVWLGDNKSFQKIGRDADKGLKPLAFSVLVAEISERGAMDPLLKLKKDAILFSSLLFILIAIAGMQVARTVARPIQQFVKATERIREGNLSERVAVASRDEIGTLATEFNSMVAKLEDVYNNLEERVTQRTAELESAQEQLVRAEKLAAVGSLAASIAHEVRNPLAGISGAIQVLGEGFDPNDSRREVIHEIRGQIERLDTIINDLLIFARPKPPELVQCDIRELLDSTLNRLRAGPTIQQMKILRQYEHPLPPVRVDPGQMEQVVVNLVINAAHAVPADRGELRIGAALDNGALQVRFHDNGPGIDPEILGSIFDPFFTTKHRGTGLGLSITRKIVEAHNGSITVRNNPDGGACFTLRLPLKQEGEL